MNDPIQKEKQLQSAYESFQRASQNKDADPDMFEQTRFRYYSLKNGPAWADQERKVINDKKMGPILDSYRQQFDDLDNQSAVQKGYTDSIATIRNKQSSLTEGVSGNIDFLANLLSEKQEKVEMYNRYIELTDPTTSAPIVQTASSPVIAYFASFPPSFATILDVFIAFIVLFLLILVLRKSGLAFKFPSWGSPAVSLPMLTKTP